MWFVFENFTWAFLKCFVCSSKIYAVSCDIFHISADLHIVVESMLYLHIIFLVNKNVCSLMYCTLYVDDDGSFDFCPKMEWVKIMGIYK